MTTLNLQVDAVSDDAEENESTGAVILNRGSNAFGYWYVKAQIGLRFTGVSGLSGSTITAATLTFRANASDTGAFGGVLRAEDGAAPGTFTTAANDISDRTTTTAFCFMGSSQLASWTSGSDYGFTTDGTRTLAQIIQELADSYDPSVIALIWNYSSGYGERLAKEATDANAPKLDITYTVAGGDATLTAVATTATALSPVSVWTSDAILSAVVTTAYAESPAAEITGTEAGTIVAAVATATALSPVSAWTADATLSAVVTTAFATSPAATIFAGAVTWQAFDETQFQLTRSDFPTNAVFYLEVVMTTDTAAQAVKMRLYNVTDSTKVTGSEASSIATSPEPTLSSAFGFPDGTKSYRLDGGGDEGGSYQWRIAKILVDW